MGAGSARGRSCATDAPARVGRVARFDCGAGLSNFYRATRMSDDEILDAFFEQPQSEAPHHMCLYFAVTKRMLSQAQPRMLGMCFVTTCSTSRAIAHSFGRPVSGQHQAGMHPFIVTKKKL